MNFEDYVCRQVYPRKEDYSTYNVYFEGKILGNKLNKNEKDKIKLQYPKALVERYDDEESFGSAVSRYYSSRNALREKFWLDAIRELEIEESSKLQTWRELVETYKGGETYEEMFEFASQLALLI